MAKPGRSHDALQQLLEERKRFEQWIATLESRRESTPEHVYNRVHSDYEQRLATVRDQLTERTGEIRSAISGLKEGLKQATEQETARVDELHEAELRAVVGEFTPEQWELRKREVEVDLKRFVDDKKKISDELNQLLLIIEQATDQGMPAEPAPPAQSQQPTPTASVPTFTPAAEAPPAEALPAGALPAEALPAEALPAAPVQADATRVRSKTPSRSRAAMQSAPPTAEEGKPTVAIESLAPAHGKRGKISTFAPAPTDPRRENEKTLKCGECGAMNYPTEWYCESCGGELSAL
ncbi:MAG: hypothetical protein ABIV11_00365 [Gemmatimonadaceae bacterium]